MNTVAAAYFVLINLLAVAATVSDKYTASHKSKRHSSRVPEKTLLIIAIMGGCVSMYITMLIIRHKTKKPKFMLTLPVIIMLEAMLIYLLKSRGVF